MQDTGYVEQLLTGWEEVAKRGQLTLWVLLALREGPKHMAEIKAFVTETTNATVTVDDQSLYRALRRYHDTEVVEFTTAPGQGPDRKVYALSPVGAQVLAQFIARNVTGVLFQPHVMRLMKEAQHDPAP